MMPGHHADTFVHFPTYVRMLADMHHTRIHTYMHAYIHTHIHYIHACMHTYIHAHPLRVDDEVAGGQSATSEGCCFFAVISLFYEHAALLQ